MSLLLPDTEETVEKQVQTYSSVIGRAHAISTDLIHGVSNIAATLKPLPIYEEFAEIRFIWEILYMGEEEAQLVRKLVDAWVEVRGNGVWLGNQG